MRNVAAKSEVQNICSRKRVSIAVEKGLVSRTKRPFFSTKRERAVPKTGKDSEVGGGGT